MEKALPRKLKNWRWSADHSLFVYYMNLRYKPPLSGSISEQGPAFPVVSGGPLFYFVPLVQGV